MIPIFVFLLRGVPAQNHGAVLAIPAFDQDKLEFVFASAFFGQEGRFEDGGVGQDLGAQFADSEVCIFVVDRHGASAVCRCCAVAGQACRGGLCGHYGDAC